MARLLRAGPPFSRGMQASPHFTFSGVIQPPEERELVDALRRVRAD